MAVLKPEKPIPEPGQSWGLFGGAFDPIHFGHLALAQDIHLILELNGVLFVPSATPQHRESQCVASFEDRCAMTELAVEHMSGFVCSSIEGDRQLSGYTIDTIRELKLKYPDVSWYLIVGADNAGTFDSWYRPTEILSETILVIGSRPGFDEKLPASIGADKRVITVQSRQIDISATAVRKVLASGATPEKIYQLVPPAVARYIQTHQLYRP